MDLHIEGKVALVCAASKGLGRASAESLAREGAKVAIAARGRKALETAASELGATPFTADMSRQADRVSLVEQVTSKLGPIEILVNNAGGPPPGPFEDHDVQAWPERTWRAGSLSLIEKGGDGWMAAGSDPRREGQAIGW